MCYLQCGMQLTVVLALQCCEMHSAGCPVLSNSITCNFIYHCWACQNCTDKVGRQPYMRSCIENAHDCRALGAGEDLKTFDVDNKWGRKALERVLTDTIGDTDPMPDVKVR